MSNFASNFALQFAFGFADLLHKFFAKIIKLE